MIYLIYEFMKAGLFAIGGGLATIPFLQVIAEKYDWFTSSELLDMIAISESTPGAIGINMATFAGNRAFGIVGGIISTISLVFPSIIIIILISKEMKKFKDSKIVKDIFYLLRPTSAGLILGAMSPVMFNSLFNLNYINENFLNFLKFKNDLIFILLLISIFKLKKVNPIIMILVGAFLGIIFKL
ncbi:MAG: chromate transporter [Peptoniphilaceae bacterium]|nr:chromate transporter [Peptoniphilaceae bacterium]MDD7383908.1 chromate transporter [Peptoniphilaceae bacterium]MDY3738051.1 chromate transporter [Peptoniphilaceae bacterium]